MAIQNNTNANSLAQIFRRNYIEDDEIPEGRVSVPFSLSAVQDGTGAVLTIDGRNYPSIRILSCIKSIFMNVQWTAPASGAVPPVITLLCPDSGQTYSLNPRNSGVISGQITDTFILPLITNQLQVVFGVGGPVSGNIIGISGFINNFEMESFTI